jgi:hypothetical protein
MKIQVILAKRPPTCRSEYFRRAAYLPAATESTAMESPLAWPVILA